MRRFTYRDENGKAWANLKTDCTGEQRIEYGRQALESLSRYEDMIEQGNLVEVVRCGECKYKNACEKKLLYNENLSAGTMEMVPINSCSYGERRE